MPHPRIAKDRPSPMADLRERCCLGAWTHTSSCPQWRERHRGDWSRLAGGRVDIEESERVRIQAPRQPVTWTRAMRRSSIRPTRHFSREWDLLRPGATFASGESVEVFEVLRGERCLTPAWSCATSMESSGWPESLCRVRPKLWRVCVLPVIASCS